MGAITPTTASVFIPEQWEDETKAELEATLIVVPRVKRFNHNGKAGDVLHVPDVSNLDANEIVPGSEVTIQAVTESETTINLDEFWESSFEVSDIARLQSAYNLRSEYTKKTGYAIGLKTEVVLLTAAVAATNVFDADGTAESGSGETITLDGILKGMETLDDNNVPMTNRTMLIPPKARNDMLKIDQFTSMDYVNKKATQDGKFGEILGMDVVVSTVIPDDSNSLTDVLIFHKDALAIAMQQTPTTEAEKSVRRGGAWLVSTRTVFGVKLFRQESIVRLALSA